MLRGAVRPALRSPSWLRRACSVDKIDDVFDASYLEAVKKFWVRSGRIIRKKTLDGHEPAHLLQMDVVSQHSFVIRNLTNSEWLDVPLTSKWTFPHTERVLLHAGAPRELVLLSGRALNAEPNACVLIADQDAKALQEVINKAVIPKETITYGLMVLPVGETHPKWCDRAAKVLRDIVGLGHDSPNAESIRCDFKLRSVLTLREQDDEFAESGYFICNVTREPRGPVSRWTLSLPGERRWLAETAMQCALRALKDNTGLRPLNSQVQSAAPTALDFIPRFRSYVFNPSHFGIDSAAADDENFGEHIVEKEAQYEPVRMVPGPARPF